MGRYIVVIIYIYTERERERERERDFPVLLYGKKKSFFETSEVRYIINLLAA